MSLTEILTLPAVAFLALFLKGIAGIGVSTVAVPILSLIIGAKQIVVLSSIVNVIGGLLMCRIDPPRKGSSAPASGPDPFAPCSFKCRNLYRPGFDEHSDYTYSLVSLPGLLLGVYVGNRTFFRISEKVFGTILGGVLILLSWGLIL